MGMAAEKLLMGMVAEKLLMGVAAKKHYNLSRVL